MTLDPIVDADLLQVPAGPGTLHVERYGLGGPPVVLLHAFGTSAFLWRAIAPSLAEDGHVVYAIDLMGYGESDRPLDADYTIAAQAEYVRAALASLRVPSAAICGVELGAGVALQLAIEAPSLVRRLALVSPVAWESWPGADIRELQNSTARHAVRIARGILGASGLLVPLLESGLADPARLSPRLVARYLAPYVGTEGVVHLLELARALHAEDLEDPPLGAIRAPTLIVRGEGDRSHPPAMAARMHAGMAGSRLEVVRGAGRLVPEEAPDALLHLLREWLEPAPPTAAIGPTWNES